MVRVGRIHPPNKQVLRDISLGFYYGAVQAEHADLGAVVETEGNVPQDLFVGGMDAPDAHHGVDDLSIGGHGLGSRK